MSGPPGLLRVRILIGNYGPRIAIVLGLLGVLTLGTAGWTYAHPPTTEVTDRTNERTIRADLRSSAVVTGDTSLYETGTRLRDEPVYLTSAAPNLTLTMRTSLPSNESVDVAQELALVVRAVHDGETFWQEVERLDRTQVTTSDGVATASATVDVPALRARLARLDDEIGAAGSVHARVRMNLSYDTGTYRGRASESARLRFDGATYAIDAASAERTHAESTSRTVSVPHRQRWPYRLPALAGVGLLAAAVVVARSADGAAADDDLERRLHASRYAEWISEGQLPSTPGAERVRIASLEGLVDVAIDANKRVIHDPAAEVYAVLDDRVVYYHAIEGDWPDARPGRPSSDPAESDGSANEFRWQGE